MPDGRTLALFFFYPGRSAVLHKCFAALILPVGVMLTILQPGDYGNGMEDAAGVPAAGLQERYVIDGQGAMWIRGTSNVRDWHINVAQLSVEAVWETTDYGEILNWEGNLFDRLVVEAPVETMHSGDQALNKRILGVLKAGQHPRIRFQLTGSEVRTPADLPEDGFELVLEGELEVAGERQAVQIEARVHKYEDRVFRITGTNTLRFSELGLEPPTALMSSLQVDDAFTLGFDVLVRPE